MSSIHLHHNLITSPVTITRMSGTSNAHTPPPSSPSHHHPQMSQMGNHSNHESHQIHVLQHASEQSPQINVESPESKPPTNDSTLQPHVVASPSHINPDSTASDQSLIEKSPSQENYSLADHIDDDNDLFECGKCKQTFSYLNTFVQHKKSCNNQKNEKIKEVTENEIHLDAASSLCASSEPLIEGHHLLEKSLPSSSTNSPLLIQSTNSPTSMLNIAGQTLTVDVHHRHQHQNRSSPLIDPLNGSTININSILSDTDLLSLSSLDANMISVGNSISPSSLLHLQGGDVSSNVDDFPQFTHLETNTESTINDHHSRTSTSSPYGTNNGTYSILNSSLISSSAMSVPISVNVHQQSSPMNVINFMNSINSSPTSFTSFIQNLSSTEVIGPSITLLKTPSLSFDGDVEFSSNDNSIGSPSRFLNLLPPPSTASSPTSIIEHRPNQQSSTSVRSTQTSSTMTDPQLSTLQDKTTITSMNVIHHHPQQQPILINNKTELKDSQSNSQNNGNQHSGALNSSKFLDNQQQQTTINTTSKNQIEPFKCSFCDRSYGKSNELANHIPCHTGEKPYQCCICGKAFGQKNNLRKHIMTHKMTKEQYQTAYRTSVDESMKNMPANSKPNNKPSDKSNDKFKNKPKSTNKLLAKKSINKQPSQPVPVTLPVRPPPPPPPLSSAETKETVIYICPMKCGYSSDSLDTLRVHCADEHRTRLGKDIIIPNSTINNNVTNVSLLTSHQMTSQGTSGHSSSVTSSQIRSLSKTESPIKEIIRDTFIIANIGNTLRLQPPEVKENFSCPTPGCGFISTNEIDLKMHCVDHKVGDGDVKKVRYRCTANSTCKEAYNNVEAYIKHLQSHERMYNSETDKSGSGDGKGKARLYRCQTCLNRYTTQNALENHKATTSHHFPCPNCSKVFPCERYLRRHLLTHGAGLFFCNYCDKSFKTANYLKVHLIIHTGEKPFQCKICDAAFNRRDKLKRHELVHDPIKRFKCPMNGTGCKREFNRPDKLKAHILTHSGVKPYQCSMCSRSFTRRAHLREHCKTHQEFIDVVNKVIDVKLSSANNEHLTKKIIDPMNDKNQSTLTVNENDKNVKDGTLIPANDTTNHSTMKLVTSTTPYVDDQSHLKEGNNSIQPQSINVHEVEQSTLDGNSRMDSLIKSSNDNLPQTIQQSSNNVLTNDQNNGSIILLTGATLPGTSTNQIITGTTDTSNNQNTSGNKDLQTLSTSAYQTFILLYSCPQCETCFFKEDEFREHECNKSNGNDRNHLHSQTIQPILLSVDTNPAIETHHNDDQRPMTIGNLSCVSVANISEKN